MAFDIKKKAKSLVEFLMDVLHDMRDEKIKKEKKNKKFEDFLRLLNKDLEDLGNQKRPKQGEYALEDEEFMNEKVDSSKIKKILSNTMKKIREMKDGLLGQSEEQQMEGIDGALVDALDELPISTLAWCYVDEISQVIGKKPDLSLRR